MSRALISLVVLAALVAYVNAGAVGQSTEDSTKWTNLAGGGISARPYVSDLSVTTGSTTTTVWSSLASPSASPPSGWEASTGKITAAVYATNMCSTGQTSGCYSSPNRVGVVIGVTDSSPIENNFNIKNADAHTITTSSIFDITIQLQGFGSTASWAWINGDMTYYSLTSTTLRIKGKPVPTQLIDWTAYPNTGCTAVPIRDCAVTASTGTGLSFNFFWSVDGSNRDLSGVAFASTSSIIGYLLANYVRGPTNPTLQYQLSGNHYQSDSSTLNTGSLKSILPLARVQALFPSFEATTDPSTFFNVSREDTDYRGVVTFSSWDSSYGTEGVLLQVTGVTFSAPKYNLVVNAASAIAMPSFFIIAMAIFTAIAHYF